MKVGPMKAFSLLLATPSSKVRVCCPSPISIFTTPTALLVLFFFIPNQSIAKSISYLPKREFEREHKGKRKGGKQQKEKREHTVVL